MSSLGSSSWVHSNCVIATARHKPKKAGNFRFPPYVVRLTTRRTEKDDTGNTFTTYSWGTTDRNSVGTSVLLKFFVIFPQANTWIIHQNRHNRFLSFHFYVKNILAYQSVPNDLCFWRTVANKPINGSKPIVALSLRGSCWAADRWLMRPSKEE